MNKLFFFLCLIQFELFSDWSQALLNKKIEITQEMQAIKKQSDQKISDYGKKCPLEECKKCVSGECNIYSVDYKTADLESDLMVFASFSMPDSIWIALSKELEKEGGYFVIRGLPKNSFQELSKKIIDLKKKGVLAPIMLDPLKFKKYEISKVPTIVLSKEDDFNKISGTVSISHALEKFEGIGKQSVSQFQSESNK